MRILGIETSCDETGAAIVENGTTILSNVVTSSQKLHIKSGGIIPEIAAREQIKHLIPVIDQALADATTNSIFHESYALHHIDAIAVTVGPGLIGSLLVGVESAKTLAYLFQKPIIPVNHLIAHLYANWISSSSLRDHEVAKQSSSLNNEIATSPASWRAPRNDEFQFPTFPCIGLLVSGGHTDLVLMRGHGKFQWLGGTRDDAAGEAFDKTARLLDLPYPGGPAIAAKAKESRIKNEELRIKLPRPMIEEENFDFSFSGLKTAVLREANRLKTTRLRQGFGGQVRQWSNETMEQLAYEIQESIADVLVAKTIRAAQKYRVCSILLGGGVAANQRLRQKFKSEVASLNYELFIPPPSLCTDNAAIVASCAYFNLHPKPWPKIESMPGLYF